jgi:hypothetical protein
MAPSPRVFTLTGIARFILSYASLEKALPKTTDSTTVVHRARAMNLPDRWVAAGCGLDSVLFGQEHAALVRAYAALLTAVHHQGAAA